MPPEPFIVEPSFTRPANSYIVDLVCPVCSARIPYGRDWLRRNVGARHLCVNGCVAIIPNPDEVETLGKPA